MPYALYEPNGTWYASVPNKDVRDDVLDRYFDKNGSELTVREISSAQYSEDVDDAHGKFHAMIRSLFLGTNQ